MLEEETASSGRPDLGAEDAPDSSPSNATSNAPPIIDRETAKRWLSDGIRVATFAIFVIVFMAAAIGNWAKTENVDPMYAYDIALRTMRFGGTYYENGIHNKGPLEIFVYQATSWFTSRDGFWYGISFLLACGALIISAAAASTASWFGGVRRLAVATGAATFVLFAIGPADWAGELYARNLTTPLLCVAWMLTLSDRSWRDRRRSLITAGLAGAALGLAVQTLTTTAFAATAVSLTLLALVRVRRPRDEHRRIDLTFVSAGTAVFLSAPIWYALRGRFTEFWSGWFTYASYMSVGTGRSLGAQFALGWDSFYAYYEHRPLAAIAILAFFAMVWFEWAHARARERIVYLGIGCWFGAAWIELILSQRYSGQYFVVSSVPTAMMCAALAGRVSRALFAARGNIAGTVAWPITALALAVFLSSPANFVDDMRQLSTFTSVHDHAVALANSEPGDQRGVRATLDLVSKDWDPLLMWTNDSWPYLWYKRVSATRFLWAGMLQGQIYLGRTSESYVLPHTWSWWRNDLAESKPVAFIKSNGGNIPQGSPFAQVVNSQFVTVYPDTPIPVQFRRDVAESILDPVAPSTFGVPRAPVRSDTGWTFSDGRAAYREAGDRNNDRLPISNQSCFVLTGSVSSDGPPGGLVFWFNDNQKKSESVNLDFDGDHVSAASANVEFHRMPSAVDSPGNQPAQFALVVGRRSASLVVAGQIRASVHIPASASVEIQTQRGVLDLADLRTGPAPAIAGC